MHRHCGTQVLNALGFPFAYYAVGVASSPIKLVNRSNRGDNRWRRGYYLSSILCVPQCRCMQAVKLSTPLRISPRDVATMIESFTKYRLERITVQRPREVRDADDSLLTHGSEPQLYLPRFFLARRTTPLEPS